MDGSNHNGAILTNDTGKITTGNLSTQILETPSDLDSALAGDLTATNSTIVADDSDNETIVAVRESKRSAEFRKAFGSFQPAQMFTLGSGKTVEEVLHRAEPVPMPASVRNKLLNWVVDLDDPIMQEMFDANDWAELHAAFPKPPPVSEEFALYLGNFYSVSDCHV